ncbi:hypothetical protein RchiOBHm_Chr2g0157321 [Rosa chinensis]|uniref:Uncharacterized protein n=1 Tax=Rosa chinensis TaxID=74649 RepID=A0A2P6S1R7_ROSCH|nr:hypothetical protein RchiOBHm_Chr2g0157321 [Rosa chinensis]
MISAIVNTVSSASKSKGCQTFAFALKKSLLLSKARFMLYQTPYGALLISTRA